MYVDNFQTNHKLKLNHHLDSIIFLRYLTIPNLLNDQNSTVKLIIYIICLKLNFIIKLIKTD